jgi:hypothetical protein
MTNLQKNIYSSTTDYIVIFNSTLLLKSFFICFFFNQEYENLKEFEIVLQNLKLQNVKLQNRKNKMSNYKRLNYKRSSYKMSNEHNVKCYKM